MRFLILVALLCSCSKQESPTDELIGHRIPDFHVSSNGAIVIGEWAIDTNRNRLPETATYFVSAAGAGIAWKVTITPAENAMVNQIEALFQAGVSVHTEQRWTAITNERSYHPVVVDLTNNRRTE